MGSRSGFRSSVRALVDVSDGPRLVVSSAGDRRVGTVSLGYGMALWSAHTGRMSPQIRFPVGETVEGRVLEISRSASGSPPRLLLDRLTIYGIEPNRTPPSGFG